MPPKGGVMEMVPEMVLKKFSKVFIVVALIVAAGVFVYFIHSEVPVALRVGSRTMTVPEFEAALERYMSEGHADLKVEELVKLKRNLLSQIIEEELVIEAATRSGITVGDDELEREAAAARAEYGADAFDAVVTERYGTLEVWKEEARRKLFVGKVIDQVIRPRIKVEDKDVEAYYESNIKDYDMPEQVHARMIVVETEKEASEVLKRLGKKGKKKEKFDEVAREVSISPEGAAGGDLGFFGRGDMPPEFEEAVFALKKGKVSGIVETPYGYHIFKLVEKREGRTLKIEDVKDEIMERLRGVEADREFNEWIKKLKEEVEIVVREGLIS